MSDFWKNQNLDGNGLQTINQQYLRLKQEPKTAYLLSALFPLGVHQFYLRNTKRGALFLSISITAIIAYWLSPIVAAVIFLAEFPLLFLDLKNTEDDVVSLNKALKMRLSLQTGTTAPPKDFRGRYHDDTPIDDYVAIKNNEVTAFETKKGATKKSKIYSFDEQEKLLKEMMKNKK